MIKRILSLLFSKPIVTLTKPNKHKVGDSVISAETLELRCTEAIGRTDFYKLFSDEDYHTVSRKDLIAFLDTDDTNTLKYIKNRFDCDDFALRLHYKSRKAFPGCAIGEIWYLTDNGSGHAVNVWYDIEGAKIWLIEPQTDVLYEYPKGNKCIMVKI